MVVVPGVITVHGWTCCPRPEWQLQAGTVVRPMIVLALLLPPPQPLLLLLLLQDGWGATDYCAHANLAAW